MLHRNCIATCTRSAPTPCPHCVNSKILSTFCLLASCRCSFNRPASEHWSAILRKAATPGKLTRLVLLIRLYPNFRFCRACNLLGALYLWVLLEIVLGEGVEMEVVGGFSINWWIVCYEERVGWA